MMKLTFLAAFLPVVEMIERNLPATIRTLNYSEFDPVSGHHVLNDCPPISHEKIEMKRAGGTVPSSYHGTAPRGELRFVEY